MRVISKRTGEVLLTDKLPSALETYLIPDTLVQYATGAGNSSSAHSYKAFDAAPFSGVSYYRLEQTDLDGKQIWSGVRAIDLRTGAVISIFPNPAVCSIRISFPQTDKYRVSLCNGNGQLVMGVDFTGNTVLLPVAGLAGGVYFIRITHTGIYEVREVVVKR